MQPTKQIQLRYRKALNPKIEQSIKDLVRDWNMSKEQRDLIAELVATWKKYTEDNQKKMKDKEFDAFVRAIHSIISVNNAGRAGQAGSITNGEVINTKYIAEGDDEFGAS